MEWDVDFDHNHCGFWIKPGYHGQVKELVGCTVLTKSGVRARVEKAEFHLNWKQITPKEKKLLKTCYGDNTKQKYHQFTRVTLKRLVWTQPMFPQVEWF